MVNTAFIVVFCLKKNKSWEFRHNFRKIPVPERKFWQNVTFFPPGKHSFLVVFCLKNKSWDFGQNFRKNPLHIRDNFYLKREHFLAKSHPRSTTNRKRTSCCEIKLTSWEKATFYSYQKLHCCCEVFFSNFYRSPQFSVKLYRV